MKEYNVEHRLINKESLLINKKANFDEDVGNPLWINAGILTMNENQRKRN